MGRYPEFKPPNRNGDVRIMTPIIKMRRKIKRMTNWVISFKRKGIASMGFLLQVLKPLHITLPMLWNGLWIFCNFILKIRTILSHRHK